MLRLALLVLLPHPIRRAACLVVYGGHDWRPDRTNPVCCGRCATPGYER